MNETPTTIRVLVVEDDPLTRLGTVTLLETQDDVDVIGEASDGLSAIEIYRKKRPDVVVLDMKIPKLDGASVARELCREGPPARVLVLSYYEGDQSIFDALKAGALGYLTKGVEAREFLTAVRTVSAGERYLPTAIAARLADRMMQPELTPREMQVLDLLFQGLSNREAGKKLSISERTVSMFVSRILFKLDAKSRSEAVSVAIKRGILEPK